MLQKLYAAYCHLIAANNPILRGSLDLVMDPFLGRTQIMCFRDLKMIIYYKKNQIAKLDQDFQISPKKLNYEKYLARIMINEENTILYDEKY